MEDLFDLNAEQKVQLAEFKKKYYALGISTEPIVESKARNAIENIYSVIGKKKPEVLFVKSPLEANIVINLMENAPDDANEDYRPTQEDIDALRTDNSMESIQSTFTWGNMESYWIAFFKFPEKYLGIEYPIEDAQKLDAWHDVALSCGWWWAYEKIGRAHV